MQRGRQKCMEEAPRISNLGKMILKCSATITWAERLEIISKTNVFLQAARVFFQRGRQKCVEEAPRISNIGKMILKCSATIT